MTIDQLLDPSYAPPSLEYTPEEEKERSFVISRLENMRQQRDATHPELDDMDFVTYYDTNARAANSYIPPKVNQDDTRIVTGTTHEKGVTLLSALLNYNLEGNINAFDDQDLVIEGLGKNLEDMVKKSREVEDYDSKRPLYYKEFLDQGDVYIEEVWSEYFCNEKEEVNWADAISFKKKEYKGKLKKLYGMCETRMIPGTMMYFGNIKEFELPKQPDVAYVSIIPYSEAVAMCADWERMQYVPRKLVRTQPSSINNNFQNWTLHELQENMVEWVRYQNKVSNHFYMSFNGIPMLPVGMPLKSISPSGEYTIVKGSCEPISKFFAISKSIPAKTKVDQATIDEMLKLIVLKTQQSFKPPMANNTRRTLSKRIWSPGTVHDNIDVTKLVPIVQPTGVTMAEMNAFEVIKGIIDEKSVQPVFSGDSTSGNQTATEILESKKQQMMKLGLAIWGVIQMEKQLEWLRIQNIMANWTQPIDNKIMDIKSGLKQNVYRTMSVDTTLETGQKGRRIIQFSPEMAQNASPEQVRAEEDFLTKETGVPTRKTYLHPEEFRKLKATFYITITPTEKDTSELNRTLFTQNIRDAAAIFGIQSLNMEYLKERFAVLAKEDPKRFFVQQQPGMPGMPPGMPGAQPAMPGGGEMQQQMMQAVKKPEAPSLNTLVKA